MTTVKNVTEKKEKKLKSLIGFLSANKIDIYNRGGKKKKRKKSKSIYRSSQNIRIINAFLESLLSESFPTLGVTVHLTSLGCPPTCADLWTCCGSSSDSNLVLLLCVLASNVHSYQSQLFSFFFSFVGALNDLLYIPSTQSVQLTVWI